MDFIYRLGGISPADEKIKVRFHGGAGDIGFTAAALRVHDRVRLEDAIFAGHFAFRTRSATRPGNNSAWLTTDEVSISSGCVIGRRQ